MKKFSRRQGGQVGYVLDLHPGGSDLTLTWDNSHEEKKDYP